LAICIGWLMHRTAGGIVAGLLVLLTGAAAILAPSVFSALRSGVGAVAAQARGGRACGAEAGCRRRRTGPRLVCPTRRKAPRMTLAPRPPESCRTMAELRAQIDRIDRALLDLLAERAAYIDRAIELKPGEGMPARTTARVAEVLANVRAGAAQRGLDPALMARIWTELIEAAIAHEERTLGPG
jgi:isochorismate pyruvate lyase